MAKKQKERKAMQKKNNSLGRTPQVKTIFKIDQATITDVSMGHSINPVVEGFDTVRGNTPEDLICWFLEQYHFSDRHAEIIYSYPGGFRIKTLWQNVAKQCAATEEEIESPDENIRNFSVQMLIVAEPSNLNQFNLKYWNQIYDKDYTEEYFKSKA